MGIASACKTALERGGFLVSAPHALYPASQNDQDGSVGIGSAVDVPSDSLARLTRLTLGSLLRLHLPWMQRMLVLIGRPSLSRPVIIRSDA